MLEMLYTWRVGIYHEGLEMENQSNNKKINFSFLLLEQKIGEILEKEAIYIPPRYIRYLENFLNEQEYSCENVYISKGRFSIKYCNKGDIRFYILVYPFEGWAFKNYEVVWRIRDKQYQYVFQALKVLDRFITYRYSLEELF